jgi:alanine racemase
LKDDLSLWAEIDLGRIERNVQRIKEILEPSVSLLAVVKANGYGHGDVESAKAAIEGGADWLGVARVSEGAALREAGVDAPILLLAEPPPAAVIKAVELNLVPTIYSDHIARAFSESAGSLGKEVPVHIKVDTGMHRYGVSIEDVVGFVSDVAKMSSLEIRGLWSHFAVAEDVLNPFTKHQLERFHDVLDALGSQGGGLIRHLANSAGALTLPESHFDMVRVGIAVYGIHPSPLLAERVDLEPVMSLKSRVGLVKRLKSGKPISYGQRYTTTSDTTIATIPCGYADGVNRALTNRGDVLIRGRPYRISGTITMDHFLVDVGDDEVDFGDEVVILGRQGSCEITAQQIADLLETIPYEVVCGVSARVPRIYVRSRSGDGT